MGEWRNTDGSYAFGGTCLNAGCIPSKALLESSELFHRAKTEFAVQRVVARVNDPRNEWLFDDAWGVDVAVSTPRMLASLVEEAVAIGDLVRLMEFRKGGANLVEITLPDDTPWGGKPVRRLQLPRDAGGAEAGAEYVRLQYVVPAGPGSGGQGGVAPVPSEATVARRHRERRRR